MPPASGMQFVQSGAYTKSLEFKRDNEIRISKLPILMDIDINSSQFPRISSRYGEIEWLNEAKRLYDERSKGSPNYKIYNDCLIETKPSWLILNRNELSDNPWTNIDKSNEYTHELKLYNTNVETIHYQGPVQYSAYYENKNKHLIMDRMKLEETLICENADIERIGRLLFYQNMRTNLGTVIDLDCLRYIYSILFHCLHYLHVLIE